MNGLAEETDPIIELAGNTAPEQVILIYGAVLLKPGGQAQDWHAEFIAPAQLQYANQSPQPPVSVHERVKSLELVVAERHFHQERELVVTVDPLDPGLDACLELVTGRRRDESGGLDGS